MLFRSFYAPGPIVEADITQPASPIFYGYNTKTVPVRWAGGPLLRMEPDADRRNVLMRFPGGANSVLSGLLNGPDEIKGRAAVVATPVGQGEVILFVTNPIWRWQNVGEFRMMFNTILNYKNLETGKSNTPAKPTRDSKDSKDKDTKEETPDPSPAE